MALLVVTGRVRTAQALVRKTGETKGRSGGLKIRLKSARLYTSEGKKAPLCGEGAQGWWMLKGKLKGANAATETRILYLSLALSPSLSLALSFFLSLSSARHPLRLISEIDRLLVEIGSNAHHIADRPCCSPMRDTWAPLHHFEDAK